MRAVDVMGFAGGFTLGTVEAGFELAGKVEMKGAFGAPNCLANRHLLGEKWELQEGDPVTWEAPSGGDVEYVFGNPPCSGFSLMSAKGFRGMDSPINHCMWAFAGYVSRVRPLVAAFESVTQAFTQGRPLMEALWQKLVESTGLPYELYHVKHNNLALGGCAIRQRYFWVVARVPFGVEQPELRKLPTLWDAIGDLENLDTTWEAQPYRLPPTWWVRNRRTTEGIVDGHQWHPNPEFTRAKALLPEAGPWGVKETVSTVARRYYQRTGTLPESWAFKHDKLIASDFKMGFHQLTRWDARQPARVITGGGLNQNLHPIHDRLFTHREVARIMGFPDDWVIKPLRGRSNLRMTWGKGIPVGSGRWISSWVRRSILGAPGSITGTQDDKLGRVIDVTRPKTAGGSS